MDNYLAGIAARNNSGGNIAFLPTAIQPTSVFADTSDQDALDTGIQPIETSWSESSDRHNSGKLAENKALDRIQPSPPQNNIKQSVTSIDIPINTSSMSYISRQVNRNVQPEKLSEQTSSTLPLTNQNVESTFEQDRDNIRKEPGKTQDPIRNLPFEIKPEVETEYVDKEVISNTLPEMKPSQKSSNTADKSIQNSQTNLAIREIMPQINYSPTYAAEKPLGGPKEKATPKLTIGKITVEIIPPATQPPAKIITRTVQAPPSENHSKINRLSFGLGQL